VVGHSQLTEADSRHTACVRLKYYLPQSYATEMQQLQPFTPYACSRQWNRPLSYSTHTSGSGSGMVYIRLRPLKYSHWMWH
jgi:hypothetical protein